MIKYRKLIRLIILKFIQILLIINIILIILVISLYKSNLSELTAHNENNIYKKQKVINDVFNYIEIEILDEENEKIEMTDYFSVSLYIH